MPTNTATPSSSLVGAWIASPEDAAFLLGQVFRNIHDPQVHALAVGPDGQVLDHRVVARGGGLSVEVSPEDLLSVGKPYGRVGVVLAHNHVGVSSVPNTAEIVANQLVVTAADAMDVPLLVLDHLIFGDDGYVSFAENGLMSGPVPIV